MNDIAKIMKRVAKGYKLLEMTQPKGWQNKVDLSKFDIMNSHVCIIGQVMGDYFDGIHHSLGLDYDGAVDHGFDSYTGGGSAYDSALQEAWVFALTHGV